MYETHFKVGSLHNPSETYWYYDLPFCYPDDIIIRKETLGGEVLNGDRLSSSLYELKFKEEKTGVTLSEKRLEGYEVARFRDAVVDDFYFQIYYDYLPFWGFAGKIEEQSWVLGEKKFKFACGDEEEDGNRLEIQTMVMFSDILKTCPCSVLFWGLVLNR